MMEHCTWPVGECACYGVPEGWQLVPIEPTPAMLRAVLGEKAGGFAFAYLHTNWQTMLNAAPCQGVVNARPRVEIMRKQIDALLAHCPDGECPVCAEIICPFGSPMHFHHDGCPACAEAEAHPDHGAP